MKCDDVTAIIPAYNEQETIASIVKVAAFCVKEVIVVDDASTDSTSFCVSKLGLDNVHLVRNKRNLGKSESVRRALNMVETKFVLFLDADLVGLTKSHIKKLCSQISEQFPMVVGLRDKGNDAVNELMEVLPKIGGERIVKTSLVKEVCEDKLWFGYNMEVLLNWHVKKVARMKCVHLKGLNHRNKHQKWGAGSFVKFVKEFIDMSVAVCMLSFRKIF